MSIVLLLCSCASSVCTRSLRDGDILFQNLDCGDLCDAIESVTYGKDSLDFSHLGLVSVRNDSVYLIESIGKGVQVTSIQDFLARSSNPHYVGRLKSKYKKYIPGALEYAYKQVDVAYDDEFLYNNDKYYCSELIYDAFGVSSESTEIFQLEPMTFKNDKDSKVAEIWEKYYSVLGESPPENEPGINPAGMSRSPALVWLKVLKID